MIRLVKIELTKIKSNNTFWALSLIYVVVIALLFFSFRQFLSSINVDGQIDNILPDPKKIPVYQFPDVWQNFTFVSRFIRIILGVLIIVLITNEIGFRTLRQNVMTGLSRSEFFLSKFSMVILLAAGSAVLHLIIGLVFGFIHTDVMGIGMVFQGMGFILALFLQMMAYLTFAFFIGLLITKPGLSIIAVLIYSWIFEPIIRLLVKNFVSKEAINYFPIKAINNLIHRPFDKYFLQEIQDYVAFGEILLVLGYISLFIFLSLIILKSRDL